MTHRIKDFQYFAPMSLGRAMLLLSTYKDSAKIIAGGTDLLVSMKEGRMSPQYVVNIKQLPDMDHIQYSKDGLKIGALATHQSIADSLIIKRKFGSLAAACSKIGTPQIRSIGTIGGNLCNAAPSADSAPLLIVFSAKVKLVSPSGERLMTLEEFLTGPGETILQTGEILTEIQVPNLPPRTGEIYLKLSARTTVDLAAVGVAALITLDLENATCIDAKIALGAVAPTPIRAKRAEDMVSGKKIEDNLIQEVAQLASEEARPISDVRGSADYRREMVKVLTRHAMSQALSQAKSV